MIGYRIWLNGYEVATTAETQATVRWFNDDAGQHVVQIKAIDAAGNQSTSSPTLLVTRPSTEPVPDPDPDTHADADAHRGPDRRASRRRPVRRRSPQPAATEPGPEATDEPQ